MTFERLILITFFGNYLINEVAAGLSVLAHVGDDGSGWRPYAVFVILAAVLVGLITWWVLRPSPRWDPLRIAFTLGVIGILVSVLTTLVSSIFGTLFDTASLSSVGGVLQSFPAFLWDISTLILIGYWILPALVVGWFLSNKTAGAGHTL